MLLADFHDADEAARWRPTDDVVMGGVSSSAMLAGDGAGIFCGELSLEGGGGFASVRRREEVVALSAYDAVELRVRGDGKRYKLNLRVSDSPDGVVYQAAFETQAGTWMTAELPLAEFVPRFRGRPATGTLDRAHVSSLGLLISDRQVGPFRLEVSSIAATSNHRWPRRVDPFLKGRRSPGRSGSPPGGIRMHAVAAECAGHELAL